MKSTWRCSSLLAAVALVIGACSQGSVDLYSGEQGEEDVLPAELNTVERGGDADSSRLVATHEGAKFYLVAGEEGDCLTTCDATAAEDWTVGCTTGGRMGSSEQLGIKADFAPAGLPGKTLEGWVCLTPQLQINTD